MIELKIDGQGYTLQRDLEDEIRAKIGHLDDHMDWLQEGHVTVSWEGGTDEQTRVHAQVWGAGHRFDASDTDWSPMTAVDRAGEKLATQIRREHRKDVASRRHG